LQQLVGNRAVMRMNRRPPRFAALALPAAAPVVAAGVPRRYSIAEVNSIHGLDKKRVGMHAQMAWESSTGNLLGLANVPSREEIGIVSRTGAFNEKAPDRSDKTEMNISEAGQIHSDAGSAGDNHTMPVAWVPQGEGTLVVDQIFTYHTRGTGDAGVVYAPAAESGFRITFTVVDLIPGLWVVTVEKKPADVSLGGGRDSQAGRGPTSTISSVVTDQGGLSVLSGDATPAPAEAAE
jgi:hypothetical protein